MSEGAPLLVECVLSEASILGVSHEVAERRRLIDILNANDPYFVLGSARMILGSGNQERHFDSLSIRKTDILIAMPRETESQVRQRAIANTGIAHQSTVAMRVGIYLPSIYLEGNAHILRTMATPRFEPAGLPPFFAVTGATIEFVNGLTRQCSVALINRDAIISFGQPATDATRQTA